MRRQRAGAVALIAGAVALGLTASGGAQAPAQPERTIGVYEKENAGSFRFVDARPFTRVGREGPRRVSTGDAIVLRNPIYSDQATTNRVGTVHALCTALNSSRSFERLRFHCNGDAVFSDGRLVFAGLWVTRERVFSFAVIGGTGGYEGARGQITIDESGDVSKTTIHLLAG